MNKAETAAALAFTALGVFMFVESWNVPYLLEGVPGPSFLPRWIAAGLVATGLVLALKGAFPHVRLQEAAGWPDRRGWARVGLMLGALAISFVLLKPLGFVVTTILFITTVIYGLGVRAKLTLFAMPLAAALGLYMVFAIWLRVPLPKGILEFLG